MFPIRTILHPTDFSEHSDYALQVAGSTARCYGARLTVLHVLQAAEPPEWIYDQMAGTFPWTVDSDRAMERAIRPLRESAPGLRVEYRVSEGVPAEEILRLAEDEECDLIVMGTHGRTGLDRMLMGSVAETVMKLAHCPVLTVKVPPPAGAADGPRTAAEADGGKVIVRDGLCASCSVHTKVVSHRDFPEIRAECGSAVDGAVYLAGQLSRAREGARGGWHREAIDRAIADVAEFLNARGADERSAEAPCRCAPHVRETMEPPVAVL
jgi:nucleotide-binding universal stress UspA family protein